MFLSGVILPFTFLIAAAADAAPLLLLPLTIFFVGACLALYARLFAEEQPILKNQTAAQLYRPNEYQPPAQMNSANAAKVREPNTGEIIRPPSVTEYTTNLLKKRDKP